MASEAKYRAGRRRENGRGGRGENVDPTFHFALTRMDRTSLLESNVPDPDGAVPKPREPKSPFAHCPPSSTATTPIVSAWKEACRAESYPNLRQAVRCSPRGVGVEGSLIRRGGRRCRERRRGTGGGKGVEGVRDCSVHCTEQRIGHHSEWSSEESEREMRESRLSSFSSKSARFQSG